MTSHKDPLDERIRTILKSPMRSEVSTSDIAVGFWSSTGLSEKVYDIEQLVLSEAYRIGMEAIGEDGQVHGYSRGNGLTSVDLTQSYWNALRKEQRQRLSELTGQSNDQGSIEIEPQSLIRGVNYDVPLYGSDLRPERRIKAGSESEHIKGKE